MRNLHDLDAYRVTDAKALVHTGGWSGDATHGSFVVSSPIDGAPMVVIAASDEGWDHISISRKNRTPNWQEMEHIARLFFRDDETAMQLHVPQVEHINIHPHVLHWWRPLDQPIPRPPELLV